MALSVERRKQNAQAFEQVFHEERVHGRLRSGAEDRVGQVVADAQVRFGNLRLAGAIGLSTHGNAADGGLAIGDEAPVAGNLGFLHDNLSLALAGFDSGLLGPDASLGALNEAVAAAHAPVDTDVAMRDAEATDYDAHHPAVKSLGTRSGQPLPPAVAARLGAAFGHDFSHVRVHTDGAAAAAADALNARAFAIGSEIWFGRGTWHPGTSEGDRILAHELTHVVQSDEGRLQTAQGPGLNVSSPSDATETEAYANEESMVAAMRTISIGESELGAESPSPALVGVSLPSGATDATQTHAGSNAGVEGTAMRDRKQDRKGGVLPGAKPPIDERAQLAAGADPGKRLGQDGSQADGHPRAPQEMLLDTARGVAGLLPADMDVVDRTGANPKSLLAGFGPNEGTQPTQPNVRITVGEGGGKPGLSLQFGGGDGSAQVRAGADGASASVAIGKDGVKVDAAIGEGGLAVDAAAGEGGLAVDAALGAGGLAVAGALGEGGITVDAALGGPGGGGGKDEDAAGLAAAGPGGAMAAGLGEVKALADLVLPAFSMKKEEAAGLKKQTGMTPEQHQQRIQQDVERIRAQVEEARSGLERTARQASETLQTEITAAKEALVGDIGSARARISGAYANARAGVGSAATDALGAVETAGRTARETLATSLPAQKARLTELVAGGRSKVDGLGAPWKKKFADAVDEGAKAFDKAGNDCAGELAAAKQNIVNTWPDAGDALERAENEARRKAASKGVDDAVADFRSGATQKSAAARAQTPTQDQQVDTALQTVRGALDTMEQDGGTQLQGAHDRALTSITSQSAEATTAVAGARTNAEGALTRAETAALGEVDGVKAQQEQSLTGAGDGATSSIAGASVSLRDRFGQWFDGVLAGIPEDQPTTHEQVKEFLDGKTRELPTFTATITTELETTCGTARQTVTDAAAAARDALTRLAEGQAQSAVTQGNQQAEGIRATGRRFADGIGATSSAVETAFTQHVQPMQGRVDERLTLAEGQLQAAVDAAKTTLQTQATTYAAELRARIASMPQTLTPMANAAAQGVYRNLSDRAQKVHGACKGAGTNESQVYNALRGLTAIGGKALEQVVWARLFAAEGGFREFLKGDLNDEEQAIAFAYLGGNTALGARLELDASMHWYGDDEAQIEQILRELSPEDLAAMKADPQWAATRTRLESNLGGTDLDVTKALIVGNAARADAYRLRDKIDEARRSRDPDALADALAGVDPAQLAAVQQEFVNIQNKVDPYAENVPPVDPRVAATQLADYATRDIESYDPETGAAQTDKITGANRDLVRSLATQGRDSVEAATSRFEVERTRSGGPNMERMQTALMAPPNLQARLHDPDPQVRAAAEQEQNQREQSMQGLYQQQYGGPNGQTMDQAIAGTYAGQNDEKATTSRRLMQNMLNDGTNSPRVAADMIALGANGAGTDEAMIKRALNGMRPDEVQALDQQYRALHGGSVYERLGVAERDANGNKIPGKDHASNQWFNELSGDDRREVEMLLQGDPQYMNQQQQLALARSQYDWQRGSESGFLSGTMNGSAEAQDLERNYANLERLAASRRPDGTFASPEDQKEFERTCGDVGINAAQYQAATDRTANYVTTGVAIVGAVVVTAATFGSGAPAGAAMIMAATGTAASGALSMAVNSGMKGGRYGWEQAATDAGVTAVSALTAGAGAYMKGVEVGVGTLGKIGSGVAIDASMGFVNGVASTATTDGTWDKGAWSGLGTTLTGGARQALTDAASSYVGGSIDETALGKAIDQSGNIWKTAAFKGVSNAAGGIASSATGIGFDAARGKYQGDLSTAAEQIGTEGAKQFAIGAGGGGLGAGIRRSRGQAADQAPTPTPDQDPATRTDGPAQDPATRTDAPAQDPATRTDGPAQDPATRTDGPAQDPATRTDPATRPDAPAPPSTGETTRPDTSTGPARDAAGNGQSTDNPVTVTRDTGAGETTVVRPDAVTVADDTGVITRNRDGSTELVDTHGNLTRTTPDGASTTVLQDGTAVIRDSDGTAIAVKGDTAVHLDAQGRPISPDGTPRAEAAVREQAVFDRVDQLMQGGRITADEAWKIVGKSGDVDGQQAALHAAEQRIARDDLVVNRLVEISKMTGPDGNPVVHPNVLDAIIVSPDPVASLKALDTRLSGLDVDAPDQRPGPGLTRPEAGSDVTTPKQGDTPLIGLETDFFDPKASGEALLRQLSEQGVPRQQELSPSERAAETKFAEWAQQNPEAALKAARELAHLVDGSSADKPIFEVDAMKRLLAEYGPGGKPADAGQAQYRLENNHALHPTAVALARAAFASRLDELASLPDGHPLKQIFVTSGGCAAGKGDLTKIVEGREGLKFGAVWDAAGEGDALENAWVLQAAQARGLTVVYGYAQADATTRYSSVLARAAGSGRVVDVMTFINSYVDGASEMRRFMDSPEYKAAVQAGTVRSFGIDPGEYDAAQGNYPNVRPLNPEGQAFSAEHVAPPADRQRALDASLQILESYVASQKAKGKDPTAVARGALENAIKFLDGEPPAVRAAVLESYSRIFGAAGSTPASTDQGTGGGSSPGSPQMEAAIAAERARIKSPPSTP